MRDTFPFPPPSTCVVLGHIHIVSLIISGSLGSYDPLVMPSSLDIKLYGDKIPLILAKLSYVLIHSYFADTNSGSQLHVRTNEYSFPNWFVSPSISHDFLNNVLPSYEAIMKVIEIGDRPWKAMHHHASFLPNYGSEEGILMSSVFLDTVINPRITLWWLIHYHK